MSSGAFISTIYEDNAGNLFSARVQPETLALTVDGVANAAPAGPLPAGVASANMSGSRRQNGINARRINLTLPDGGTPPADYKGTPLSVPILTAVLFAAISKQSTVVYLGATWNVAGTTPEKVN